MLFWNALDSDGWTDGSDAACCHVGAHQNVLSRESTHFPAGRRIEKYHRDCADDHEQKIESNEMININQSINQSMYSRTHELKCEETNQMKRGIEQADDDRRYLGVLSHHMTNNNRNDIDI